MEAALVTSVGEITSALEPLRRAFEADGYTLDVAEVKDGYVFSILATPDACEECLAPKRVIQSIIERTLDKGGAALTPSMRMTLKYPTEHE